MYLLVGVNSDEQCHEHKSKTVMSHAERCEAVRHCRYVISPSLLYLLLSLFVLRCRRF